MRPRQTKSATLPDGKIACFVGHWSLLCSASAGGGWLNQPVAFWARPQKMLLLQLRGSRKAAGGSPTATRRRCADRGREPQASASKTSVWTWLACDPRATTTKSRMSSEMQSAHVNTLYLCVLLIAKASARASARDSPAGSIAQMAFLWLAQVQLPPSRLPAGLHLHYVY